MRQLVSARSIASVLCEGLTAAPDEGARMFTRWIVTSPAFPLITKCGEGELEKVELWINTRLHEERLRITGRLAAEFVSEIFHHGSPWPSTAPAPLTSTSCRPEPLMKSGGE